MPLLARFRSSSSFSLGVIFTLLLGLGIYFSAYFLVVAHDDMFIRESKDAIRAELAAVDALGGAQNFSLEKVIKRKMTQQDNLFIYLLVDPDNQFVAGNIPAWPKEMTAEFESELFEFEVAHQLALLPTKSKRLMSEHYDILAKSIEYPDGSRLLVGRNIDDLEIAQFVAQKFGWLTVSIMIFISVVSFAIGFYVFKTINRMSQTADEIINTGNLSKRLFVNSKWDDLSKLSASFNLMLDEIEQLVNGIKSVSDNIAHDLRTPVTRLRVRIDRLEDEKARDLLIGEVDNVLSIFNGLLRIAEVETERQKKAFKHNDVELIVQDVVELYSALAESKNIKITLNSEPANLFSDRDLLFQTFSNILDNAIKFTPDNGSIDINLAIQETQLIFSCADSGPGIAPEYREKVLQRFFRVEKSRTTSGNGLGLSMVAASIRLHQGVIELKDTSEQESLPGLKFMVAFPMV